MKLIFERSVPGRHSDVLPPCDVEVTAVPEENKRQSELPLPELSEVDVTRHYTELAHQVFGVNCGFYPLGSCTMKYNPRVDEETAAQPGFTGIHPLAPASATKGCCEVVDTAKKYLCEISGMDDMTFQPAAGAHGEFTGVLLIRQYHDSRKDTARKKIIVPDSAHGTNPATASMCGFEVVNVASAPDGGIDLDALAAALGPDTAGLMLTNPNTLGLFDRNILKITSMVHEAGGLCYYDGANLNAVMGLVRPGDMGFDCVHMNLHKTFATPHGGGGPGAGAVGCKSFLAQFLPHSALMDEEGEFATAAVAGNSAVAGTGDDLAAPSEVSNLAAEEFAAGETGPAIAHGGHIQVRGFSGNFLIVVRALTYIMSLGKEGIPETAENAVLNANYLMHLLEGTYKVAYPRTCMHEFVLDLHDLKEETGCSALDVAKTLIDYGIHPPTMYFPLIVHEALMLEPTETESKETLDDAAKVFLKVYQLAHDDPEYVKGSPHTTKIGRPDEVQASRHPVVRYVKP